MNGSVDHDGGGACPFETVATAMLDSEGTVVQWSQAAANLVGRTAPEVCGRPVWELLADVPDRSPGATAGDIGIPAAGRTRLRHQSGGTVDVEFQAMRLATSSELLVLAAPTREATERERHVSLGRALFHQDRVGIAIHDTDLAVVRTNVTPEMFSGPIPPCGRLREVMSDEDAEAIEAALRQVLETGVPLIKDRQQIRSPRIPGRQRALSLSAFRLEDAQGRPTGVATMFVDTTEQQRTRRHLDLRHEASVRIGGSLDAVRTAQDLADLLVPALGDLASVNLADAVLEGDEPSKSLGGGDLHLSMAAVAAASGHWPEALVQPGAPTPKWPDLPELRESQRGLPHVVSGDEAIAIIGDPHLVDLQVPKNGHSAVSAPLIARGLVLGVVTVWRTEQPEPFDEQDAALLMEIASRAALGIDNARRYTREHRAAVALQKRLLPPAKTETAAAETTGIYRPAGGGAEISGDWFDAIPLPSLRVALVVGDVVGHGMPATATMGRLRTAIQTLADLELDPEELLTHLDDLVQRLAAETSQEQYDAVGATCLYAVYDPVVSRCTLASAGHPPPLVVRPDGTTQVLELSPGPPLGVGGMPFETTTIDVEPSSILALYTDGLMVREDFDVDAGLGRLADNLAALCRKDCTLDDVGRALLADLADNPPRDDAALLLARTRVVPPENTAYWEFPADPTVVADAREVTAGQLAAWGLEDLTFTTELIVSELVTNAIRYGGGSVGLRLIRENVLVCEVTDPSNTQPRLRRALWTDEGGRGLFLVAQLSTRWGSRYGQRGKTIWAEQPVGGSADLPTSPY